MSERLKRHYHELHVLNHCKPGQRKLYLSKSSPDLVKCVCEVCHNILKGNIELKSEEKKKLKRYKKLLRFLSAKQPKKSKGEIVDKRKRLVQHGGFLPLILTPLLTIATELITDLIRK